MILKFDIYIKARGLEDDLASQTKESTKYLNALSDVYSKVYIWFIHTNQLYNFNVIKLVIKHKLGDAYCETSKSNRGEGNRDFTTGLKDSLLLANNFFGEKKKCMKYLLRLLLQVNGVKDKGADDEEMEESSATEEVSM